MHHLDLRDHDRRLAGVPAEQALDRGRPVHRALDRPRRRRVVRHRPAGRLGRARRRALDDPSGGRARRRAVRPATGPRRARSRHVGGALRPAAARDDVLETLAASRFDLLVIGGGIVGCAVAWLGARAGLRVALVERGDLAGATSSASSKLIHGGLRYLQMGDIGLVREAHAERHALARVVAPHLVRPRAFLVPVYRGGPVRATKLRAGLVLYGGLGRFEDGGGSLLRPRAARSLVPCAAHRRAALGRSLRRSRDQRRAHDDHGRAGRGARRCLHRHARRGGSAPARGGRVAGADCTDVLGGGQLGRQRDLRRQRDRSRGSTR